MSAQPSEDATTTTISSATASSTSASTTTTSTSTTTIISEQDELRAHIQKLELENNVLQKQTERATQDSESFRNQAVSQLQSLQKNVSDKNKLIKSLKNGLKVAAAAAAASTPATTTTNSKTSAATLRELETMRSELVRANARTHEGKRNFFFKKSKLHVEIFCPTLHDIIYLLLKYI